TYLIVLRARTTDIEVGSQRIPASHYKSAYYLDDYPVCKMRLPTTNAFDSSAFFVAVATKRRITHYRKRQIIFSQGDQSDSIFYIEKGHVKLSVVSAEGKEAILSVCGGGSFFGESCI